MTDLNQHLEYLIASLPEKPGVYLMKDINGEVIYVGKAINLKNRVSSYFTSSSSHSPKTKRMVGNIKDFEYIVLDNEKQAFITESDLIKSLRPKYNVLMKDDKSYPYIKVTLKEEFPGLYVTRNKNDKDAKYFGPYPSKVSQKNTVALLQSAFPVRSCKKMARRPCINYDMGLCLAPCSKECDVEKYNETVKGLVDFLSGKGKETIDFYKNRMQEASDNLEFEKAAEYRDKIDVLTAISDRHVLDTAHDSVDVIAYASKKEYVSIFIMMIRNEYVADKRTINFKKDMVEETDIGYEFLRQYYEVSVPANIVFYNPIPQVEDLEKWLSDSAKKKITITIPKRGSFKKLADTAYENAKATLDLYLGQIKNTAATNPLYSLTSFLSLDTVPDLIEAYDVSHFAGKDAVASGVVYKDGAPLKSAYRRYKISEDHAGSDTDSIKEVLERRIKRGNLPDLFLIDGGKNQVSAALEVVKDLVPVVGMVKDDRHRTKALVYNLEVYDLEKDRNLFVFISSVQNEAHRFAISYNKQKRTKRIYESELDHIEGIGEQSKIALLKHFGSVRQIKAASLEQIRDVEGIGLRKAEAIYQYFHKE